MNANTSLSVLSLAWEPGHEDNRCFWREKEHWVFIFIIIILIFFYCCLCFAFLILIFRSLVNWSRLLTRLLESAKFSFAKPRLICWTSFWLLIPISVWVLRTLWIRIIFGQIPCRHQRKSFRRWSRATNGRRRIWTERLRQLHHQQGKLQCWKSTSHEEGKKWKNELWLISAGFYYFTPVFFFMSCSCIW